MKTKAIILSSLLMLAAPVFAQQTPSTMGQDDATTSPHSMMDMMKQCQTHCRNTQQEIAAATEAIKNAKSSDDIETMRQALEKAETSLSKMSGNMTSCLGMMDMMSNMHGMMSEQGMMQKHGMMMKSGTTGTLEQ